MDTHQWPVINYSRKGNERTDDNNRNYSRIIYSLMCVDEIQVVSLLREYTTRYTGNFQAIRLLSLQPVTFHIYGIWNRIALYDPSLYDRVE